MRKPYEYLRAIEYLFNYFFLERPRGLDFSLRDLSDIKNAQYHGYAMTSDRAIKNISRIIDFSDKSFLDIGSGKGRVLTQAIKNGASIAEGIEVSKKLSDIATKNFEVLNIADVCKSNCIDATEFDRYKFFDIFFLFNPFEDELYEKVIDVLMEQCTLQDKKRFIICYGGANLESIEKFRSSKKIYKGVCPHRRNSINIFQLG